MTRGSTYRAVQFLGSTSNAMNRIRTRVVLLGSTCVFAPVVHADIGVPMVAVFLPPMWLSLVPVILLESWIMHRVLVVSNRSAILAATVANLVTTLIGIPLVWLVLAVAEAICCGSAHGLATFGQKLYAVTAQAPWLIPYESDLGWMIPTALVVLLVPFFFITVAIEGYVSGRILPDVDPRKLWRATWVANAWSYLLIALLAWPALLISSNHLQGIFGPLIGWLIGVVIKVAKALAGAQ